MVLQVQTQMMGDLHHYAWRARHRNQTVYINKRDSERFGDWTSEQCAVSQVLRVTVPPSGHTAAALCLLIECNLHMTLAFAGTGWLPAKRTCLVI